jgi:hypothetical protein
MGSYIYYLLNLGDTYFPKYNYFLIFVLLFINIFSGFFSVIFLTITYFFNSFFTLVLIYYGEFYYENIF